MATTLRILKKKSKQAAAIIAAYYPSWGGDVFPAVAGENYHGYVIRCTHGSGDPAYGKRPYCQCSYHPLKGTPMTGGMSGYYEPEWSEDTMIRVLQDLVMWGDRPASMSDRQWRRTLAVAGVKAFDEDAFMAEMAAEDAAYFAARDALPHPDGASSDLSGVSNKPKRALKLIRQPTRQPARLAPEGRVPALIRKPSDAR